MSRSFFPLWTDAYMADTRHLTTLQHGAYLLLLMAMWRSGGKLPNDPKRLAKLAGLPADRWARISPEVMELFIVDGESLTQKRLSAELEKSHRLQEKRQTAGRAGGVAKSLKDKGQGVANAMANACPLNLNLNLNLTEDTVDLSTERVPVVVSSPASEQPAKPEPASEPAAPSRADDGYAFESGCIKLNSRDLNRWKRTFSSINVESTLSRRAEWINEQNRSGKNWFYLCQTVLGKANEDAERTLAGIKAKAEAEANLQSKPRRSLV